MLPLDFHSNLIKLAFETWKLRLLFEIYPKNDGFMKFLLILGVKTRNNWE